MLNRVSLDGFFAGPNGEIDWFVQDPEVDEAAHEKMSPDTLLLGRVTYQMFESYWPPVEKDPNADKGLRKLSKELNEMTKVVFSNTLRSVTWVNSKLMNGDITKAVKKLKQGNGADIAIFGSGTVVQQLAEAGLVDEYIFIISPVVTGTGKPLFQDIQKFNLKLLETRDFDSGNVLLHYGVGKMQQNIK
jgi:dihydrofolate reductase